MQKGYNLMEVSMSVQWKNIRWAQNLVQLTAILAKIPQQRHAVNVCVYVCWSWAVLNRWTDWDAIWRFHLQDPMNHYHIGKGKGKRNTTNHKTPHCYGNSRAIWTTQCYLPPDRGDIPALTSAKADSRLSEPGGMQGWVDIVGWLHTETVYRLKDGHPPIQVLTGSCDERH